MNIELPKPRITREQIDKFTKDPEVVTLEVLFVILTLSNVFVLYRILLNVFPYPIFVTWAQLVVSLAVAYILGEASQEFPRYAYFPAFTIDWNLYKGLAVPTVVYLGMITMANVLLHLIPSAAAFPVAVSLAVILHHVSRFLGCGQMYLPIRWISMAIMLVGFLMGSVDSWTFGCTVFPIALLYAIFSATFRAWCLEKAMHLVAGRGNSLHNHQVLMGVLALPLFLLLFGEGRAITQFPFALNRLRTWQLWGCLITAGTIPFVKNVVANRMIRRTGQAPWRALEILSMIFVFVLGGLIFNSMSVVGGLAFLLVVSGRILGMLDVLSKDPDERRRALRSEATHRAAMPESNEPRYDPTGVADSFDQTENELSNAVGSESPVPSVPSGGGFQDESNIELETKSSPQSRPLLT